MARTFQVCIDAQLEVTLDRLQDFLKLKDRAELFRVAIALLNIIVEASINGETFYVCDKDGNPLREIDHSGLGDE